MIFVLTIGSLYWSSVSYQQRDGFSNVLPQHQHCVILLPRPCLRLRHQEEDRSQSFHWAYPKRSTCEYKSVHSLNLASQSDAHRRYAFRDPIQPIPYIHLIAFDHVSLCIVCTKLLNIGTLRILLSENSFVLYDIESGAINGIAMRTCKRSLKRAYL